MSVHIQMHSSAFKGTQSQYALDNSDDCSIEDAGMIHLAKGAFVSL